MRRTDGAVTLVKINVDTQPAISDQLRIQSLPTVMLMLQGRFVDTFKGVLPDAQLADFVEKGAAAAAAQRRGGEREGGAGEVGGEAGVRARVGVPSPPQDPAVLVRGAFAALDAIASGRAPLEAKEDAARAFSHVLAADTAAGPALKARLGS